MSFLLAVANIFFFVFHTILILFNVFGWIWKKTRIWNLATLAITALSWFAMGLWKGVGYCLCTDWHWHIRHAMGITNNPDSYLVLLVQTLTGWTPPVSLVNPVALAVFLLAIGASIFTNVRDWRARMRPKVAESAEA